MKANNLWHLGWMALVSALPLATGAEPAPRPNGYAAISRPSYDVTLSFSRPGRIEKIHVKEGDRVSAGQVLVEMESAAERFQVEQLKAAAEETIRLRHAQAQRDQKALELQRTQEAFDRNAATDLQVQQARLEVTVATLSVELVEFESRQNRLKYEEAKAQVDRLSLAAPADGRVEKLLAKAGESVESGKDVLRVVSTEKLWLDVPVALSDGAALKVGDAATVEVPGPGGATMRGTILYIASVAESASETRMVRIEVVNTGARPAGEHALVRFDAPGAAAGSSAPAAQKE